MKKSLTLLASFLLTFSAFAGNFSGYKIGIDPGHGGSDPGAQGPSAPHEATLCLAAATELMTRLQNDGASIMMTRYDDSFIDLSPRANKFEVYDPYLALSMHLNAHNTVAYGTESWYCRGTIAPANDMFYGLLGCMGHGDLSCTKAPTCNGSTFGRGVKQTCWRVINISSNIPATLTEGLFVDNPTEHAYLCTEGGRNAWVTGHQWGIYKYFHENVNGNIPGYPQTSISDTESPVIHRAIVVPESQTTFRAYAYVSDNVGVREVKFPTRTYYDASTDDVIWHNAENGSWNIDGADYNWRVLIPISSYSNKLGDYTVQCYAWDQQGNYNGTTCTPSPFVIDNQNPTVHYGIIEPRDANSFWAYCYATDNDRIAHVRFPTWTENNDRDDLIWHDQIESGNWTIGGRQFNYRSAIPASDHKGEKTGYIVQIYVYDRTGNVGSNQCEGCPFSYDTEPPVIHRTAVEQVNQQTIWVFAQVTDNIGVKSVRFPMWSAVDGQDDLIYHEAGSGEWNYKGQTYNYCATISAGDHKYDLHDYTIQCYAWDATENEAATWVDDDFDFDQTPMAKIDRARFVRKDNNGFYIYAYLNTENVKYSPETDYYVLATVHTGKVGRQEQTFNFKHGATEANKLSEEVIIDGEIYNVCAEVPRSLFDNTVGPYYAEMRAYNQNNWYVDYAVYNGEIKNSPFVFDEGTAFIERAAFVRQSDTKFRLYSYLNTSKAAPENQNGYAVTGKIWTDNIAEADGQWGTCQMLNENITINGEPYNNYFEFDKSNFGNTVGNYYGEVSCRRNTSELWLVDYAIFTGKINNSPFRFHTAWVDRATCVQKDNNSFYVYAYLNTNGTATPDTYVVRTKVATTDKEKWLTFDHNGKNRLDEEITIDGLTYNCYGIFDRSDFENSDGPYFVETRAMANNENYLTDYALFNDRIFNNPFTFKKTETTDNNIAHKNNKILIYNTHEMLFVENVQAKLIELFNVSGQKVRSVSNRNSLNLNNLNGVYIVVVTDTKGNRQIGKIVK